MSMDGDKQNEKTKISNFFPNARNVLFAFWVRRDIRTDNEMDRVVLESGLVFLFPDGCFFLDFISTFQVVTLLKLLKI